MGLSRNKVAVSEGAAGSPPFYGERRQMLRHRVSDLIEKRSTISQGTEIKTTSIAEKVFCCSIFRVQALKKTLSVEWGCSSVGRAPALQAGGQEFESLHLHQGRREEGKSTRFGLIAQQARARA